MKLNLEALEKQVNDSMLKGAIDTLKSVKDLPSQAIGKFIHMVIEDLVLEEETMFGARAPEPEKVDV